MVNDEEQDYVPNKDIPEGQDDEFARTVQVRDAARRAFVTVNTDQKLCPARAATIRQDRWTLEPGDLCYFVRHGKSWSPGIATLVSQVGQGHYYIDYGGRIFKQAKQILPITGRTDTDKKKETLRYPCPNPRNGCHNPCLDRG